MNRTDETWHRLIRWTAGQTSAERLAGHVLRDLGYKSIDPSHPLGGPDGKHDAIAVKDGRRWIMAAYFPHDRKTFADVKKKFLEDLPGVKKNGADGIAFVVNQELTLGERRSLTRLAKPILVDVVHLEILQHSLDSPGMADIRMQYLGISYGDPGATIQDIQRVVDGATTSLLEDRQRSHEKIAENVATLRAAIVHPANLSQVIQLLPSVVADAIEEGCTSYPQVVQAFETAANSVSPGDYLSSLIATPPRWLLSAPESIWHVLAETAVLYAETSGSVQLIKKLLPELSGALRDYWLGRLALFAFEHSEVTADSEVVALLDEPSDHPIRKTVSALQASDRSRSIQSLDSWQTEKPVEQVIRTLLLAKSSLMADGGEPEAILILRNGLSQLRPAALLIPLARLLTYRVQVNRTDDPDSDLDEAIRLALEARDQTRRVRGDATQAVLAAVDACIVRRDWDRVERLSRPHPDGEATAAEVDDVKVRTRSAICAAVKGQTELARALSVDTGTFHSAWLDAIITEAEIRSSQESFERGLETIGEKWEAALELAADDDERLTAIRGLAASGSSADESWNEVFERNPDAAEEIRLIADAAPDNDEPARSRKARLRGLSRTNRFASVALAEILETEGDISAAAAVLDKAGETFADQNLRLSGASMLRFAGEYEEAIRLAEGALAAASPKWPGRARAWSLLHDIATEQGDWPAAIKNATKLLALNAGDDTARWMLAVAQVNSGEFELAWGALTRNGTPPPPPSTQLALMLLKLRARFGAVNDAIRDAVMIARTNRDDEKLLGEVIQIAHITLARPLREEDATSDGEPEDENEGDDQYFVDQTIVEQLQAITDEFFTRYPDSNSGPRRIDIDPENPLAIFDGFKRQAIAKSQAVRDLLQKGYPAGAIAPVLNRFYSEILFDRLDGAIRVRAEHPAVQEVEILTAEDATSTCQPVLIEASTLRTLAMLCHTPNLHLVGKPAEEMSLPSSLLQRMIGSLSGGLHITDHSIRDLAATYDGFGRQSELGIYFDDTDGEVRFYSKAEDLATRRRWVTTAMKLGRSARIVPGNHSDPRADGSHYAPWMGSVETARNSSFVLWSDDSPLRSLAHQSSVPTFGTCELIDALASTSALSLIEADNLRAALLVCGSVDLEPSLEQMRVLAQSQAWQPGSVGLLLGEACTWRRSAASCVEILQEALKRSSNSSASAVRWFHLACAGAMKALAIDQHVPQLAAILASVMLQDFCTPATVNAMLTGARSATGSLIEDVWREALAQTHRIHLMAFSESQAAELLLRLVQSVPSDARHVAMSIILGPRD